MDGHSQSTKQSQVRHGATREIHNASRFQGRDVHADDAPVPSPARTSPHRDDTAEEGSKSTDINQAATPTWLAAEVRLNGTSRKRVAAI